MKTDTIIRLGRKQYRSYATTAKEFGCYLDIASRKEMPGTFGLYDPWAKPVCLDASSSNQEWDEIGGIIMASEVDTCALRRVVRPEIDWSVLEDEEIYPFILNHEIGHKQDNFNYWATARIQDLPVRFECEKWIRLANEVLADRYAWSVIRPGESVPLSEHGRSIQEDVSVAITLLDEYVPRVMPRQSHRETGQYFNVPSRMLLTSERCSFVGPRVSEEATRLARSAERRTRERLGMKPPLTLRASL